MFLSFIIPLYNCEKYISECLDSIYAITLSLDNYEVIIIDDGSIDCGVKKCKEYLLKYPNISLISQKNSGASSARNKGLLAAKGEYVWFVDADDAIEPSFIETAHHILEQDRKIEVLSFNYVRKNADRNEKINEYDGQKVYTGVQFLQYFYSRLYLWNKIYRKKYIGDFLFLEGTKNLEDMCFNLHVLCPLKNIKCIEQVGYYYNCTNTSSTSRNLSKRNLIKLSQDTMTIHADLVNFIHNVTEQEHQKILNNILSFSISGHLYSLFRFYSFNWIKKTICTYRKWGFYPVAKTDNSKANIFLWYANRERLFLLIYNIIYQVKRFL